MASQGLPELIREVERDEPTTQYRLQVAALVEQGDHRRAEAQGLLDHVLATHAEIEQQILKADIPVLFEDVVDALIEERAEVIGVAESTPELVDRHDGVLDIVG